LGEALGVGDGEGSVRERGVGVWVALGKGETKGTNACVGLSAGVGGTIGVAHAASIKNIIKLLAARLI